MAKRQTKTFAQLNAGRASIVGYSGKPSGRKYYTTEKTTAAAGPAPTAELSPA